MKIMKILSRMNCASCYNMLMYNTVKSWRLVLQDWITRSANIFAHRVISTCKNMHHSHDMSTESYRNVILAQKMNLTNRDSCNRISNNQDSTVITILFWWAIIAFSWTNCLPYKSNNSTSYGNQIISLAKYDIMYSTSRAYSPLRLLN